MRNRIFLSFDVEDWFQVENLRSVFPPESWEKQTLHVEENIDLILNLLDKYNIKATFFVLGWIAQKKPKLIKRIHENGHEVASHGYGHLLNYNLSKDELIEDLKKSKEILENIIDDEVIGYRAPSFSISDELLEILFNLGFKYDSSYNAFSSHDRYGSISTTKDKNGPFKHDSGIIEIPLPLVNVFNMKVPISGGGYFRIYPLRIFDKLVNKYMKNNEEYVFYMHPWEFDIKQPKIKNIPLNYRVRHYFGINKSYKKLDTLLSRYKDYNFEKMKNIIEEF